jgi:hypothetical protein
MELGILMLIAIVICFVVILATSWPNKNAGLVAAAIGLVCSLILLFKPV